jgi:AI-2 transport protein TqsA
MSHAEITQKNFVDYSIILLGIVVTVFILKEFQSFLRPFVIAIVLAFLFVPLTRLSIKRKIIVWLISFSVIFFIILLSVFLGASLISEISNIDIEKTQSRIDQLMNKYAPEGDVSFFGKKFSIENLLEEQKDNVIQNVGTYLPVVLSTLASFFSELMIVLLFLLFIMPSHDLFIREISHATPKKDRKRFRDMIYQIETSVREYVKIKSLISLLTAILCGILMFVFGVKYILLFMLLVFLLNFIPNIGSFFAVLMILISHFISLGFSVSLIFLGLSLVLVQFLCGNYIEPKVSGVKMEISPILILLSLFFWGYVWGITGMFFAVPLTVIIKIIINHIVVESD